MNMKKILVPVDGSETSKNAAEQAVTFARKCGSALTFLIVVEMKSDITYTDMNGVIMNNEYYSVIDTMIKMKTKRDSEILDQLVESLNCGDLSTDKLVLVGDANQQITETAEKGAYDLIIMGHRGLNPIKRLFLGSVAKRVIEDAPCSVMVVNKYHKILKAAAEQTRQLLL